VIEEDDTLVRERFNRRTAETVPGGRVWRFPPATLVEALRQLGYVDGGNVTRVDAPTRRASGALGALAWAPMVTIQIGALEAAVSVTPPADYRA
jgi:hypothetical protein